MTQEEAIKILKDFHDESALFSVRTALETLYPELKESEGEKVRKALVEMVRDRTGDELWEDYNVHKEEALSWLEKQGEPQDKGEISDGYHTFNELYYYRMLYNAAFFNMLPKEWVHKSKRHNDGEECFGGGWFIVMANLPTGQISNHYELKDWDLFQIPEKEVADKWDGHTPQEAADRLHKYLLEKQGEQKSQRMISAEAKEAMYDKLANKVEPKCEESKTKVFGAPTPFEDKLYAFVLACEILVDPSKREFILEHSQEILDAAKEQIGKEQKSAWSEEDEKKMLADACIMLDWYQGNNWWKAQHIKNWLKSLKQRIGG